MPNGGYVNPLAGVKYTIGRTDQGVDFEAGAKSVGKPIGAMGRAKILYVSKSYQGYGQYVAYQLLDGPMKGRAVFVGHSKIADGIKVGRTVAAGQAVATIYGYDSWPGHVEIGWADPTNPANTQARSSGTAGKNPTPEGQDFRDFFTGAESNPGSTDTSGSDAAATDIQGVGQGGTAPVFDTSPMFPSDVQPAGVETSSPEHQLASMWEMIANQQYSSPETRLFAANSKTVIP